MQRTGTATGGLGSPLQEQPSQEQCDQEHEEPPQAQQQLVPLPVQDGGWLAEAAEPSSLAILHGEGGGLLWSCGKVLQQVASAPGIPPPFRIIPGAKRVRVGCFVWLVLHGILVALSCMSCSPFQHRAAGRGLAGQERWGFGAQRKG